MKLLERHPTLPAPLREKIRFDRNELSGAFGDIGTDFPLVTSMILVCALDAASVLVMFGLMQVFTGMVYGLPMAVQPLKAMAVIVITQKLSGDLLNGGGLSIGVIMLLLTVTGLVDWLAKAVPKTVVRGIQFGLGLQLASLALKDYVPADGGPGYVLAAGGFLLTLLLLGNRRYPPALFLIALGVIYGLVVKLDPGKLESGIGFALPQFHIPTTEALLKGLVVLALPQLPLSLGNSILATRQVAQDFFPERPLSVRTISLTYALMNLVNPFCGGVPTCHGSGGLAGHYTFGARTGGSVIIYGSMYLILGLFLSGAFSQAIQLFPKPILGVILTFEGLALMKLIRDVTDYPLNVSIVLLVGLMAFALPYGYVLGLIVGTILAYLPSKQLAGPSS